LLVLDAARKTKVTYLQVAVGVEEQIRGLCM
jgi:hypothetical protein